MQVRSAMTKDVVYVTPTESLDSAWLIMKQLRIRHLPVLNDGKLVGILSDRDVLLHARIGENNTVDIPTNPVSSAMTTSPVTCRAGSIIADVVDMMLQYKIDCLPVTEVSGKLIGLITTSDLLELLRDRQSEGGKIIPFDWELRHGQAMELAV